MGPTATYKKNWYWPVVTNPPMLAHHGTFDEMRYGPGDSSPNTTMIQEKCGYIPPSNKKETSLNHTMKNVVIVTSTVPFVGILGVYIPKGCGQKL